jgi:hypothetical protein
VIENAAVWSNSTAWRSCGQKYNLIGAKCDGGDSSSADRGAVVAGREEASTDVDKGRDEAGHSRISGG